MSKRHSKIVYRRKYNYEFEKRKIIELVVTVIFFIFIMCLVILTVTLMA